MNDIVAIDIGASSGRIVKFSFDESLITCEEVCRFSNGMEVKNGNDVWDLDRIFKNIKECLQSETLKNVKSIGIDTWGVDFVLLDKNDKVLGSAVSYRDKRTNGMIELFSSLISKEDLYKKTGIQFQQFNTIFQLYYISIHHKNLIDKARSMLFIADYIGFLLTGVKTNEYTNSTTSQMININTKDWDKDILEKLGMENCLKIKPVQAGTKIGELKNEVKKTISPKNASVIATATHDTASAVVSVPAFEDNNWAYISSGTWSLMGIEGEAINTELAMKYNFTNEGGYRGATRVLKNIMGLWMLQRVKKEFSKTHTFAELESLARETKFDSIIDVSNSEFFNPTSMITAIKDRLKETNQKIPSTDGEIVKCIYISLASFYAKTVREIEEISGRVIKRIHIIGGGSKDEYLNQLTSDACQVDVFVGPTEGSALGNAIVQYISLGVIKDLKTARKIIRNSFAIKKYSPNKS